jgi:predicted acetyltransferase
MRAQLDDVRGRGEPVAYLWASEETIYGRFGYGMAALSAEISLPRVRGAFRGRADSQGRLRLVTDEEARELVPAVYDRVAEQVPGMFARSDDWWRERVLADPPEGELFRAVLEVDGRAEAYALYRLKPSWESGSSTGTTIVREAMGASPPATAAIWRFLLDVDWMDRVEASLLPVDHELLLLLAEPRRMKMRIGDSLWVRLVDLKAALAARSYAADGSLVLEVADAFCPWNEGRWELAAAEGRARVRKARRAPDLRCDVSDVAAVYLGGFTWSQLVRAGRVAEARPGAAAAADALFRTDRAPWCPEIF